MEWRRAHELKARLHEPLARPAPERKRQLAARVLFALLKGERVSVVSPVEARARLFAAASSLPRDEALGEAARGLEVSVEDLEASLFADLPGQRVLGRPPPGLDPSSLALRANLAVAQGLLARASRVRVDAVGNAHAVVRHARLRGLLCTVSASITAADGAVLELSGPMSLFRRTTLYGRALATLPPTLSWCDYLQRKLAAYRAAALDRLILCVDVELQCDEGEAPSGARLVRFKRRIDVDKVLELL